MCISYIKRISEDRKGRKKYLVRSPSQKKKNTKKKMNTANKKGRVLGKCKKQTKLGERRQSGHLNKNGKSKENRAGEMSWLSKLSAAFGQKYRWRFVVEACQCQNKVN